MKSVEYLRERFRPWYLRKIHFPLHPERKPRYFDSCWSYPDYRPDPDTHAIPDKPLVLFLPMNDWHTRTQRTQHLALVLSGRGYRCLYLNPHLGREFPAARRPESAVRLKQLDANLLELHVHLPREPVFHHRLLLPSEAGLVAEAISWALQVWEARKVVQIVALPVWWEVARIVRGRSHGSIIYDCHDFLPGLEGVASPIIELEPELFRHSDLVICSSQTLMARAQGFAGPRATPPCLLLRNAAAGQFFEPSRARTGSRPVIGYAGALESWFDVASVEFAARAHPEWQFELIGRVENRRMRPLEAIPNVHFAGEVPFERLPAMFSAFSVGMIPFLLNALIEATDPIKAYEYLAAGLPVVSSRLPEIERFGDLVSRYTDAADFVSKLEAALASDSDAQIGRRRQAALQETWERRGEELAATIQSLG